jgi:CRP/FNR family transcriptional regulator, cyclic AMP receptor protein
MVAVRRNATTANRRSDPNAAIRAARVVSSSMATGGGTDAVATTTGFSALSEPVRRHVLELARRRRYEPGSLLLRQGDDATSLLVIESGRAAVRFGTPTGESVILAVLGPGEVVGELGLLDPGHERTASVEAIDEVVAWALRHHAFDALRRRHLEIDDFVLTVMARQVQRLTRLVAEALYVPAEQRVVRRLHEAAQAFADARPGAVVVPLTQEELAQLAGTSRPTANQALQKLERRRLVRIGRGRVEVLDMRRLGELGGW